MLDVGSGSVNNKLSSMDSDSITQTYAVRLRAAGLRVTQPRLAILEVLHGATVPMTIEAIHESLARADCDLVTVYRCIEAFEEIGLAKRFFQKNGTTAFTTNRAKCSLFVMSEDGSRPAEVKRELNDSLWSAMAAVEQNLAKLGYRKVTGLVQFFGEPPAQR